MSGKLHLVMTSLVHILSRLVKTAPASGLFRHLLRHQRSYLSSFFLSPLTLKPPEDIKGNDVGFCLTQQKRVFNLRCTVVTFFYLKTSLYLRYSKLMQSSSCVVGCNWRNVEQDQDDTVLEKLYYVLKSNISMCFFSNRA